MQENKKAVLLKGAFCTIIVIACILWVIGLISAVKQPTYKSWFDIGEPSAYSFEVNDLDQKIVQQFEAPCDEVFEKVAVRIGTHWGKSRSQWKVELFEGSEEERIYEGTFDAEEVKDNSFFNVIDEEIKVNKDLSYKLVICTCQQKLDTKFKFFHKNFWFPDNNDTNTLHPCRRCLPCLFQFLPDEPFYASLYRLLTPCPPYDVFVCAEIEF